MRIGILQCDNVRSTLSESYGEYPDMIKSAFEAVDDTFTFTSYPTYLGVLPDEINDCDAYIITGSRHSVFDHDKVLWINPLRDFVVKLNKAKIKLLGICFGHQLIADAMGGKVERADCGWQIGVHRAEISHNAPFMEPKTGAFYVPMMCEDQVQSLGDTAEVLASSPNCEYAMIQYESHILTTQGHPEFSQAFAKALINLRQDEFPSKRLAAGLTSFSENEIDSELLFTWFANFLKQNEAGEVAEDEADSLDPR